MIEGNVAFSLGGKTWSVPPLPWKIIKIIEPALLDLYKDAKRAEVELEINPEFLDKLANLVFRVVQYADPDDGDPPPTREEFENLHFKSADLLVCLPLVGKAAGLQKEKPNGADKGESDAGKQTGTVLSLTPALAPAGPPSPS
jgi:hypothetical protein